MKDQKDSVQLQKILEERTLIASEIGTAFKTHELVSVEPDFKEVTFYVCQDEFDRMQRNFSTAKADFKFEKADKSVFSLYYSYTIK